LHGHEKSSFGKKQSWYSPMGAWLVMALDARVHNELEWPTSWSHGPPLV